MDSAAIAHITNNSANFDHATQSYGKEEIIVGNGEKLKIKHTGFIALPSNHQNLNLKNVLHAPQVTKNLISVSKLTADNNVLIEFDSCGCYVKDKNKGRILLIGNLKEALYEFQNPKSKDTGDRSRPCSTQNVNSIFSSSSSTDSIKRLWHVRLGQLSNRVLNQVVRECNIKTNENDDYFCEPCQFGKNRSLPFKLSISRANSPLELIHTDVWGPLPVQSTSKFKIYIQFLDDFSRYSWI